MRISICSLVLVASLTACGGVHPGGHDLATTQSGHDLAMAAFDLSSELDLSASTDASTDLSASSDDLATTPHDAAMTPHDLAMGPFAKAYAVFQTHGCLSCHMQTTWDSGENLKGQAFVDHLTNTLTTECPSLPYVTPNDPANSYVYQKITGTGSCFTGAAMPFGSGPLDTTDANTIKAWILNGATTQ